MGPAPSGRPEPSSQAGFYFPDCVSPSRIVHQTRCFTPSTESLTHCDAPRHGFQSHHYYWKESKCRDWQAVSMNAAAWRSQPSSAEDHPAPPSSRLRPGHPASQAPPPLSSDACLEAPRRSLGQGPPRRRAPDPVLRSVWRGGKADTLFCILPPARGL